MNAPPKSLHTLEYDKVIARLANLCETGPGRTLAQDLLPSSDYREVLHRQRLTAEARRLLEMKPSLTLVSAADVRDLARQAALGHILEPADLLHVQATGSVSRTIRDTVGRLRVYTPYLAQMTDDLADFGPLTAEIGRAISPRADVLDNASPVLAQLRRDAREAHDRLYRRLQQLVSSQAGKGALQDPIVTLRDGRYVLPVKSEMRAQLPGIVHDVSSSGATVFLEPLETVEMGNAWREVLIEEEREIARILRGLSALVGDRAEEIVAAVDILAQVDLCLSKARLGKALKADLPYDGLDQPWLLSDPRGLRLAEARHPLLKGNVVPLTLWLGESGKTGAGAGELGANGGGQPPSPSSFHLPSSSEPFTVLLITGPNTGGKTVALKTVGLLAVMAAAGLPVPAGRESRIPVFDAAYADIGDEQSIEQSLSTFSSHTGNIIDILNSMTPRSLVLLDELGAGTDPAEGSALAKAVLSRLLRTGCLAVATTHHGELKAFAHVTLGIANASVEFDPETLSPTYRMQIGLPGQSNALAIARRLGMPEDVLQEALAAIDPDRLAVEALIFDLHRQREAAEMARASQEEAAAAAKAARARVTQELTALETRRERLFERTVREMEDELASARGRLREALKRLEHTERMTVFEQAAAIEEAQVEVKAVEQASRALEQRRRRRRPRLPRIQPGDRVYLRDLPLPGEALAPPVDGEIEVKLGALRARIPMQEIERVERPDTREEARSRIVSVTRASDGLVRVAPELHVRGMTVDEALGLVEQRLDEAFRAGVSPLRLVHGKGTGTLRRAVRDLLSKHPLVRSYAPADPREGGDGVTVVNLAV